MRILCRKCNIDITDCNHLIQDGGHTCFICKINEQGGKLNKVFKALEFYADKTNYVLRGFMNEVVLADNGVKARETLDEIRKRSIDLCGEETKESQDKEVEKME